MKYKVSYTNLNLRRLGGSALGKITRTLLPVAILVLLAVYFLDVKDEPGLKQDKSGTPTENHHTSVDKKEDPFPAGEKSLDTIVGIRGEQVKNKFGQPDRIDPSAYGYDWWVYNQSDQHYIQVGVENGKVVTVFAFGTKLNTEPFIIGEKKDHFLKDISLDSTVSLNVDGGSYQFELSEKELNVRPLIPLNGVWAILYFDQFTQKLAGIRYVDAKTLVKLRPYALTYRGELISASELSRSEWRPIEAGAEQQIFDMTNIIRKRFGLDSLKWNEEVAKVAFQHSKEMAVKNYFSHTSPTVGTLGDRFHNADISYLEAGGNIAAHYTDGISAMFGWLNSKGHRKNLLHKGYTGLGVGVYQKYYTQNFIKPF